MTTQLTPRNKRLADGAALALTGAALLGSVLAYRHLPERFPIHFDLHGTVDGTAPRAVGAFAMPVVSIAIWLLLRALPARLSGEAQRRVLASPLPVVSLLVAALLAGLHFVMLDTALTARGSGGRGLGLVLALFSLALGLVLPKLRRNGFAGIRTPPTLASDETWQRTHRMAGMLFVGAGLVGLLAVPSATLGITIGALVFAALASAVYSFVIAGKASAR